MEASDLAAVGFHEPPAMEVWLTRLVLGTVGRGWYRRHIDGLGLKGDERVMDFGSGAGIGAKYVAEILKDGHLTCVDISTVWLGEAKRRMKGFGNVDFLRGDICGLAIPDGSYDAIIVTFVLHDMPWHERTLKLECLARKLKKGGRLFITEPISEGFDLSGLDVRKLLDGAGLAEVASSAIEVPLMGRCFDATYLRP